MAPRSSIETGRRSSAASVRRTGCRMHHCRPAGWYAHRVLCSRIRENSGAWAVSGRSSPKSHDFGYAHRVHLPIRVTLNAYAGPQSAIRRSNPRAPVPPGLHCRARRSTVAHRQPVELPSILSHLATIGSTRGAPQSHICDPRRDAESQPCDGGLAARWRDRPVSWCVMSSVARPSGITVKWPPTPGTADA